MNGITYLQEKTLMALMNPAGVILTGVQISRLIGLKERHTGKAGADMRSIIHALRVKGYPVCAKGVGYYLAQNSVELSRYITEFQGRVDKQQEAVDGLKKAFIGTGDIRQPKVETLMVAGKEVGKRIVDN